MGEGCLTAIVSSTEGGHQDLWTLAGHLEVILRSWGHTLKMVVLGSPRAGHVRRYAVGVEPGMSGA